MSLLCTIVLTVNAIIVTFPLVRDDALERVERVEHPSLGFVKEFTMDNR